MNQEVRALGILRGFLIYTTMHFEVPGFVVYIIKKGGCFLDQNGYLWRVINGDLIGKPSVQMKDLSRKWICEADPEQIDDRYYNKDGTKK